jgi:hypothetical protein
LIVFKIANGTIFKEERVGFLVGSHGLRESSRRWPRETMDRFRPT